MLVNLWKYAILESTNSIKTLPVIVIEKVIVHE